MLKKDLSPILMIMLVIGATVGGGIFTVPGSAASIAGPGSLLAFVIASVAALAMSYIFGSLGYAHPVSNGLYEYTKLAFGKFMGGVVGWCYWIFMWSGVTAVLIGFMGYLATFIPGIDANPLAMFIIITAFIWIFVGINIAGVKTGATWGMVFTIIKLIGLAVFVIFGLTKINFSNFTPFLPQGGGSIVPTLAFLFWSFCGIESAVTVGEEAQNPQTIRKSSVLGSLAIIVVYGLVLFVCFGVMPSADLANSNKALVDVAGISMGSWSSIFMTIVAAISILGCASNTVLLTGRTSYAMAQDGMFPKFFGTTNDKKSPASSIILGGVCANLLLITVLFNSTRAAFDFTLLFATLFLLIPYILTMVAIIMLRVTHPEKFNFDKKTWPLIVVCSLVGFVFCVLAIWGSGFESMVWGFLTIVVGAPVLWAFIKIQDAKKNALPSNSENVEQIGK
ncbi:MAG: amino acid permease [Anaerolineaceae bacterium]